MTTTRSLSLTIHDPRGAFAGRFGVAFEDRGAARVTTWREAFALGSLDVGADRDVVLASIERALYRAHEGLEDGGVESRTRRTASGWEATVSV